MSSIFIIFSSAAYTIQVKCEFKKEAHACKRCLDNNYECTILDRKIKRQTLPYVLSLLLTIARQS